MAFLARMANETPSTVESRVAAKQPVSNNMTPQDVIQTPIVNPQPIQVVSPGETNTSAPAQKTDITPKFFEEEKPDAQETKPVQEEQVEDELESVINPGAEHFKKLRKSQGELKRTLADTIKERQELSDKLKLYETGEIVSDVLKEKDEEITRLAQFEKLVNLKGSREYKEKYVTPIEQTKQKLKEIFADYGVPAEQLDHVVNKALNTSKRPELNAFLIEHLGNDELGASEAKAHVFKAWELQKAAQDAEAEPAKALENLQQEQQAVTQVREQERRGRIVKVAENTWVETLNEIRTEGQLLELIHKPDDPEFNTNYPDRLLPQAAKEYGKMITELGKQGISDIPKPLAKAIAKMVLLAHASGVAVETRNRAMNQVDDLTANLTRYHSQLRPQIGGGVARGQGTGDKPKPLTAEQEAYAITNQVLAKRV